MEYNNPSEIVKDLNFGNDARSKVLTGVDKLAAAVKSTLGASGMCVISVSYTHLTLPTKA